MPQCHLSSRWCGATVLGLHPAPGYPCLGQPWVLPGALRLPQGLLETPHVPARLWASEEIPG